MEGNLLAFVIEQVTCMQVNRQDHLPLLERELSLPTWAHLRLRLRQLEQHLQFVTCMQISHRRLRHRIRFC